VSLKQKQGFTIIELISVLALIAILSITILSKTTDFNAETIGGREVIKNHIRYSQLMAMKSNRVCGVQFNGSVYSIFRNGSTADKIIFLNKDSSDFPIPSPLGTTTEIIYFDL